MKEMLREYGQSIFEMAEATDGIDIDVKAALLNLTKLSRDGFEKWMRGKELDALATPGYDISHVLAIDG